MVQPNEGDRIPVTKRTHYGQDSGSVLLDHPPPTKRRYAFSEVVGVKISKSISFGSALVTAGIRETHLVPSSLWCDHITPFQIKGCPSHLCELNSFKFGVGGCGKFKKLANLKPKWHTIHPIIPPPPKQQSHVHQSNFPQATTCFFKTRLGQCFA